MTKTTSIKIGCLQVYTGNGKGKTTAAVGLVARAVGAGRRVFFLQFLKARPTGEIKALQQLQPAVTIRRFGRPEFIIGQPTPEDLAAAQSGLAEARQALLSGEYDVVILDEANQAVSLNLFSIDDLLAIVRERAPGVEAVITGRQAHPRLMEAADLVTEMCEVKHYHNRGVPAREGIDY